MMSKVTQKNSGEERVTAKSKPMMNLVIIENDEINSYAEAESYFVDRIKIILAQGE